MGSKIKQSGYSLIEILVVIAILGIVVGIGALQTREAMRGYRIKAGVDAVYAGFGLAKNNASLNNKPVTFTYNDGNLAADFTGDNGNFYRVQLSRDNVDPGPPVGNVRYNFAVYCVMTATTSDGSVVIGGADIDGNGAIDANDNVDIVNPANVPNITINPNGTFDNFSNGGVNDPDAIAFVFQNQTDIDEGYAGIDRNYALILVRTGFVAKLQQNNDGTWELM